MPQNDKDGVNRKSNLVRRILDNPELPAYIKQLEPGSLHRLVQFIGKEDAEALIVHASPTQLQELVEADAWQADAPGAEEAFDPAKFLEWLALFDEMGSAFLCEKLQALGSDHFALALDHHVVVVDITSVGVMGDVETFGTFGVLAKDEESWPPLRALLTDIWDEDADFVESALRLCCQRRSMLAENTHIAGNDTLYTDVSAGRDARRQRQGYVTPLSASVFLGETMGMALDELIISVAYDPVTAMQLRAIRARKAPAASGPPSSPGPDVPGQDNPEAPAPGEQASQSGADFTDIEALMKEAEVIAAPTGTRLLGGPSGRADLSLRDWLRHLGESNAQALETRMEEIVYLSNILVAGTSIQGAAFTEAEAAQCVYATCNLGIDYCLTEAPFDDEQAMLATFLESEPGMIKAFRIGYHLIAQLPFKAIVALVRSLTSTRAQRRMHGHPWIQQQVADALDFHDLSDGIRAEHIGRVKEILELLETIFEPGLCEQLRIICDPLPCVPKSLEADAGPQLRVNRARRYIRDTRDLRQLLEFLDQLDITT